MAFGTWFPPKFSYPSKVHKYRPCSVCTLQDCGNRAVARAVLDVPSAIAATRQPNAQVKARELIIVLVNFGFIVIISFYLIFLVLAFFDFSLLSCHFWPFTEVLRKIFGSLTREVLETFARRWKNEDSFGRAAETNVRA